MVSLEPVVLRRAEADASDPSAKVNKFDVVLVDTAGRMQDNEVRLSYSLLRICC